MVREHTLYDFNSFHSLEVCFMAQNMVYLEGNAPWALENNVCSAVVGWSVLHVNNPLVDAV